MAFKLNISTYAYITIFITTITTICAETILCNAGLTANGQDCKGQTISCTSDDLCIINCKLKWSNASDYGVCQRTVINCKPGQICEVLCDAGNSACRQSTINATQSSHLLVTSTSANSFNNAEIYCPTTGGNCFFQADPFGRQRAFAGVTVLAINGFFDDAVQFECTKKTCVRGAFMKCGIDYNSTCPINEKPTAQEQCANDGPCSVSYNPTTNPTPIPSVNPTINPTIEHTLSPSEPTLEPTTNPTLSPSAPTLEPTTEPTFTPTGEPTGEPTFEPSGEPTLEPTLEPTTSSGPNILFIWFDDLGFNDVNYNGGPYETPFLNDWANNDAIKLNFHYSEQVCSASRSALLTGKYSWKSGLNTVTTQLANLHFDPSLTLFPELLQDAGYQNYLAGKWHVGYKYEDICPHRRGFMNGTYGHLGTQYYNRGFRRSFDVYDEQFPCRNNTVKNARICTQRWRNFRPQNRLPTHDTWTIENGEEQPIYIGDHSYNELLFSEGIKDFIQLQTDSTPFYIQYNLFTPHSSLTEPPNSTNGSYIIDYDSICNDSTLLQNKQLFCRQMWYAQLKIDEIFDTLKANGHWNNTFIVITSDNGAAPVSEGGIAFGQTLPLRGTKSGAHEGGIRTPAMIKGGYIERLLDEIGINECEYDGLVHVSDWYQILTTIADITHNHTDSDHSQEIWNDIKCKCDPLCNGNPTLDIYEDREELITMRVCGNHSTVWPNGKSYYSSYIRKGDWKLVVNGSYSITDGCPLNENFTGLTLYNTYFGYDVNNSFYPTPHQLFYNDIYLPQFQANYNRSVHLYQSLCLENLTNTTDINDINYTLFTYSPFMLFNVKTDKIEACNVASIYPQKVTELFSELQNRSFEYNADENSLSSPGALYHQIDSWDCETETTYTVPWEGTNDTICGTNDLNNVSARECNPIYKQLNTLYTNCNYSRRRLVEYENDDMNENDYKYIYSDVNSYAYISYVSIFIIGVIFINVGILNYINKNNNYKMSVLNEHRIINVINTQIDI